jgi:type IV pilus assembly protein PilN
VIKINLLEETRQQAKAKGGGGGGGGGPKFQMAGNFGVILLLSGLGAAVAGVFLWWFALSSTITKLDDEIVKAEAEKARLEYVIKRNEELQRKKEDLNRKIGIIAELKRKQALPVQLLDLVSRNLADFVWLEELTYTGELVTIKGKALTPIALANFLRSLEDNDYFADVALQRQSNEATTGHTSFDVNMTFKPGGKAAAAKASGPSGASAPPPA